MQARNANNVAAAVQQRQRRQLANHRYLWARLNEVLLPNTNYRLTVMNRRIAVNQNAVEPWRTYFGHLFPRINQILDNIYNDVPGVVLEIDNIVAQTEQEVRAIRGAAPRVLDLPPELRNVPVHQLVQQNGAWVAPDGELARFARDNQNVHTTVMVKQTKEIVDRVLKIKVPKEYSYKTGHKTLAEILLDVHMSDRAADWFASKYLKHDSIYDYARGIFAKVTDAVWQYVRNSPDKSDLCRIMRTELEDNVGMCLQGNLTRMCNVLAGYLEGINTESPGEQLQRRMAALMAVENEVERVARGKDLLQELAVPAADWAPWLEALA